MMNKVISHAVRLIPVAVAVSCFTGLLLVTSGTPSRLILYGCGALCCCAWTRLGVCNRHERYDFIHTGDGAVAAFVTMLLSGLAYNRLITPCILIPTFYGIKQLQRSIIDHRGRETLRSGFLINIIIVIGMVALQQFSPIFDTSFLQPLIMGIFQDPSIPDPAIAALFISSLFLYSVTVILMPECSLFAQGKTYFAISGLDYKKTRLVVTFASSLLFVLVFCSIGFFGGFGLYWASRLDAPWQYKDRMLATALFAGWTALFACSLIAGPVGTLAAIIMASTGLLFNTHRREIL